MIDLTESVTVTPPSRTPPVREDCWTEEATATLIDSWGRRYLELNRGNLRQKDWQEVADAVNALHGLTKKTHRTDVQCKNRVDTVKKKYKVEKQRVLSSDGVYVSDWVFFDRMDFLIGNKNLNLKKPGTGAGSGAGMTRASSPPLALPYKRMSPSAYPSPAPATAKVVALPQRKVASGSDDGYFRRNYSAMAAAAAAAEAEDEDRDEEEEYGVGSESDGEVVGEGREKGFRRLVKAIEKFGKLYEKVEVEKLRHTVELEKQRMQFEKDMEVQRMQMFMDTQVQIERIKRRKKASGSSDIFS